MNNYRKAESFLGHIWRILVGSQKELSNKNRVVNAVLAITAAFLIPSTLLNVAAHLMEPFLINCVLLAAVSLLYHLSRFRKMYKLSLGLYALCCYAALIGTFFYNAGSKGPALFLFFLIFHLLIAISPRQQHIVWAVIHIFTGLSLMYLEYRHPLWIENDYPDAASRFMDIGITYTISLLFVYVITIHLRRNYDKEKKTAKRRAELIQRRSQMISKQNAQLKRIAWLQSHKVRSEVATIMGLSELINFDNPTDQSSIYAVRGIKSATENLDNVIKEINEQTQEVKGFPDYNEPEEDEDEDDE